MKTSRNRTSLIIAALLPWLAAGCGSDATGPGSNTSPAVSLSLAVVGAAPSAALVGPAGAFDLILTGGGSTITITRVAVVAREIELERVDDEGCDGVSGSNDHCEKFEAGPFLFEMPLDGTVISEALGGERIYVKARSPASHITLLMSLSSKCHAGEISHAHLAPTIGSRTAASAFTDGDGPTTTRVSTS